MSSDSNSKFNLFRFFFKTNSTSHGVWLIAFWGLFMGFATTMIYSQLGMFLKHELHADTLQIALLDGIVELLSYLTRVFAGVISDFIMNRRSILIIGCLFSILIKPLFVMANSIYTLLLAQSLDRVTNGMQASPRDALIADLSEKNQRGISYGLTRSLKTTGALLGTISAVAILYIFPGEYRLVFGISFLPAMIALYLLIKVKESKKNDTLADTQEIQRLSHVFSKEAIKALDWQFWKIILFAAVFELSHYSDALLSVRANDFVDPTYASAVSIIMNIGQVFFAYPIGLLSDKLGKKPFVMCCLLMMISANLLFLFAKSEVFVFIGAFFWGGQMSTTISLILAIITENIDKRFRGTAIGIYYTVIGLGYMCASCIAGQLWRTIGSEYAFIYSLSVCAVSFLIFPFIFQNKKKEKHDFNRE